MNLGGLRIIERVIFAFHKYSVNNIVIIVGYSSQTLKSALGSGEQYGVRIQYVKNHDWKKGSGTSLYAAREAVSGEDHFLVSMADHWYEPEVIGEVLKSRVKGNLLCVDKNIQGVPDLEDATKVDIDSSGLARARVQWLYAAAKINILNLNSESWSVIKKNLSEDPNLSDDNWQKDDMVLTTTPDWDPDNEIASMDIGVCDYPASCYTIFLGTEKGLYYKESTSEEWVLVGGTELYNITKVEAASADRAFFLLRDNGDLNNEKNPIKKLFEIIRESSSVVFDQPTWKVRIMGTMPNDLVFHDGMLYVATRLGGIDRYDPSNDFDKIVIWDQKSGLPSNDTLSIAFDQYDNTYVGTKGFGLWKLSFDFLPPIDAIGGPPSDVTVDGLLDESSIYWGSSHEFCKNLDTLAPTATSVKMKIIYKEYDVTEVYDMTEIATDQWCATIPPPLEHDPPLHGNIEVQILVVDPAHLDEFFWENWLMFIDPSGIVTDADTGLPIEGATVTLEKCDPNGQCNIAPVGSYIPNQNPQSTTINGGYGWNVSQGKYRVHVEKDGYQSIDSRIVDIPPPVLDLDVQMQPISNPLFWVIIIILIIIVLIIFFLFLRRRH